MSTTTTQKKKYKDGPRKIDRRTKEKLILEYAPLIKFIAQKIAVRLPSNIEFDDLVSSGVIGLMDAIDKFQPDRGLQFQGRLGADERGLDDAATSLATVRLATDARRSVIEDTNLAEAAMRMSQAELAYKSALSAVSAVERRSLLDYLR